MNEADQLKRALLALRVIHTWASTDARYPIHGERKSAMRDIANKAAEGLNRPDLIKKERI